MSKVLQIEFDASADTNLGDAFAEHSIAGNWLAFHGTSSVSEDEIESPLILRTRKLKVKREKP
jgi:hypothetical protein